MRIPTLLLLATVVQVAHAAAGPLDGATVEVRFEATGKGGGTDRLVFADGTVAAPGIRRRFGFEPAPYAVERGPDAAIVTATMTSAAHGEVVFTMTIVPSGEITGTRVWSKPGKDPIEHPFTGTLPQR